MIAGMNRRFALFAAPLAVLLAAASPPPAATAPAPDAPGKTVNVELATALGAIVIAVDVGRAPITGGNFLAYVDGKRFDGTDFYRAMHLEWGEQPNGLVQGGTRNVATRILPPITHEPTTLTGIKHTRGTVSMARFAPGTATGDFTIMLSDLEGLDANPADTSGGDNAGFAAFGHVVSGMDVVRAIYDAPRSPTQGTGVMKGQMLDPPVRILSARRVPAPAPVPVPASGPAPAGTP